MKSGITYFPLDIQMDEKIELLEAKYGIAGFAVIIKIYQRIYSNGYYCKWDEDIALMFAHKNNCDTELVENVVSFCVERGIYDKEIYEKHGALTSKGIQKRYFEITKRRKDIEVEIKYCLLDVNILPKNVYIIEKNVYRNEQRKEKERKEKEIVAVADINTEASNNGKVIQMPQPPLSSEPEYFETLEQAWADSELGDFTRKVKKTLKAFVDKGMSLDCILYAIDEADSTNERPLAYIKSILNRLLADGIMTKAKLDADIKQKTAFKKRIEQQSRGNPCAHVDSELPENDYFRLHNSWDEIG